MTLAGKKHVDVVVVGAGHNGLVCATLLARAGLSVLVVERSGVIGGASRTEQPFPRAPRLRHSTGAYLLGLMPPELLNQLNLSLPLLRRDPHYFLPTLGAASLLLGSDEGQSRDQLLRFFSEQDWRAVQALQNELGQLRDDLAPVWLQPPHSLEETAERYVRPALRTAFIDLCRRPIAEYLQRFSFQSELLLAMYATTDAFSGLDGTWNTPGTGHNFLVHNMCRLPGADGTWMILRGGLGTLIDQLEARILAAGGQVRRDEPVAELLVRDGAAVGVLLGSGEAIDAKAVVCATDPFTMLQLAGDHLPRQFRAQMEALRRPGTTLKLNLALSGLPRFTCLPEDHGQHRGTMHLLPQGSLLPSGMSLTDYLVHAYEQAKRGEMPACPTIEWYVHTTVDPSLASGTDLHSSALFVQWVPNRFAKGTWAEREDQVADQLLSLCDEFAPGTSALVVDRMILHPEAIEARFGMRHGHIHHVDNAYSFDQRVPYRTPLAGLYAGGAGSHPAGSVIGAAGHNAAHVLLRDLGLASHT